MTAPVAPSRACPEPADGADLVRRLVLLLGKTLTASGHVAQRVEFERRGYCSVRREAPVCTETLAALHDAIDWLEASGAVEPIPFEEWLRKRVAVEGDRSALFGEEAVG